MNGIDYGAYRIEFSGSGSSVKIYDDNFEIENNRYDRDSTVFVDVGNSLQENVFDHHNQTNKIVTGSAAEVVFRSTELINIDREKKLTIVTHKKPDLDAIVSTFLLLYHHQYGSFPMMSEKIIEFVSLNDTGCTMITKDGKASPLLLVRTFDEIFFNDEENHNDLRRYITSRLSTVFLDFFEKHAKTDQGYKKSYIYENAIKSFEVNKEFIYDTLMTFVIYNHSTAKRYSCFYKDKIGKSSEEVKFEAIDTIESYLLSCADTRDHSDALKDDLNEEAKVLFEGFQEALINLFGYSLDQKVDAFVMQRGLKYCEIIFEFFGKVKPIRVDFSNPDVALESSLFKEFPQAKKYIDNDYNKFNQYIADNINDIEHFKLHLFKRNDSGERETIRGVKLPSYSGCSFAKDYLRNQGYDFTFIPTPIDYIEKKTFIFDLEEHVFGNIIISVTPECNVYLRGLGEALELKERAKETGEIGRIKITIEDTRIEGVRSGYEEWDWSKTADPWYNSSTKKDWYTLIASPRRGTVLAYDEIWDTVRETFALSVGEFEMNYIIPFTYNINKFNVSAKRNFDKVITHLKKSDHIEEHYHFVENEGKNRDNFVEYINDFYFNSPELLVDNEHKVDVDQKKKRTIHFNISDNNHNDVLSWVKIGFNGTQGDLKYEPKPKCTLENKQKDHLLEMRKVMDSIDNDREPTVVTQGDDESVLNGYMYVARIPIRANMILFRYGVGFIDLPLDQFEITSNMKDKSQTVPQYLMMIHELKKNFSLIKDIIHSIFVKHKLEDYIEYSKPILFPRMELKTINQELFSIDEILYKMSNGQLWVDDYQSVGYTLKQKESRFNINEKFYFEANKMGCAVVANTITKTTNQVFFESTSRLFSNEVKHIIILSLQQRYSLIHFSSKLAKLTSFNELSNRIRLLSRSRITNLRKLFLDFTTQGYFSQITNDHFLSEVYKSLSDTHQIKELYDEVDNQIETIDNYNKTEFSSMIQAVSYIGIPLVVLSSIGGSALFNFEPRYVIAKELLIGIAIGTFCFVVLYDYIKGLFGK